MGHSKWINFSLTATAAQTHSMNSSTSISAVLDPSVSVDLERPMRRLTWCHGAGSAIAEVRCDNCYSTYLLLEPQMSVVFAFNARVTSSADSVSTRSRCLCRICVKPASPQRRSKMSSPASPQRPTCSCRG